MSIYNPDATDPKAEIRKKSFHNTIMAEDYDLFHYESKASGQEKIILAHFRSHPARMFTPSEIHKALFDPLKTPLTSVRRGITNLCNAGFLRKTDIKTQGPYGMPEHCWYYPRPTEKPASQLGLF